MRLRNTENNKPAPYVHRNSTLVVSLLYREMLFITLYYSEESMSTGDMNVMFVPGSTPHGCYQKLIQYYRNGDISFKYVKTFNMDEYVGGWVGMKIQQPSVKRNNFIIHLLLCLLVSAVQTGCKVLFNMQLVFCIYSFFWQEMKMHFMSTSVFRRKGWRGSVVAILLPSFHLQVYPAVILKVITPTCGTTFSSTLILIQLMHIFWMGMQRTWRLSVRFMSRRLQRQEELSCLSEVLWHLIK